MKKLTLTLLVLICALCCALGLAACDNDGDSQMIWLYVAQSGETPSGTSTTYTVKYGETPDLSTYKLYGHYDKNDDREISRTDEKLSVKYYYIPFGGYDTDKKEMSALPTELLAGIYTIEYVYDGNAELKAEVDINVERAQKGAFSVQPVKSTWYGNEKTPNVIVKNPKGMTVSADEHGSVDKKSDDSNGYYFLYYIKKSVYDSLTEAQKTDYEFMQNYMSEYGNKGEYNAGSYLPEYNDILRVGDWMIFALIDNTHNYWNVVTPATQITVRDSIVERTFTFQSMVLQDMNGNVITDSDNEYVGMTDNLNTANQGKTVICKANGEIRGTVDFGGGVFNELSAEEVFTYEKSENYVSIRLENDYAGEGNLSGNTLTVKILLSTNQQSYYWVITFNAL